MMLREEKSRNRITLGQDGNALVNLIAFNGILFIILKFIYVIYQLSDLQLSAYDRNIFAWFILPADISKLASRPWTLLTFMFTHRDFLHLLSNFIWLGAFGYILQDLTGNRKLIPIYIYGGFAGAFLYILSYHIFHSSHLVFLALLFSERICLLWPLQWLQPPSPRITGYSQ